MDQLERLIASVERAKRAYPVEWRSKGDARLLAALRALLLERIPRDPLSPEFRQGNTLGKDRRHWFRAKFGGNRFRLFFRADSRPTGLDHRVKPGDDEWDKSQPTAPPALDLNRPSGGSRRVG